MTREEIDARHGRLPMYVSFMGWTAKARPGTDEHREIGRRHLQFQLDNQDRGILFGAGPINGNRTDAVQSRRQAGLEKGPAIDAFGMSILVAPSYQEAERLWQAEPFEQLGWREHNLCSFSLNHGAAKPLVRHMIETGPDKTFQPRDLTREEIAPRLAALDLYISFMRATDRSQTEGEHAQEMMGRHRQYLLEQAEAGVSVASGPLNYDRREESRRNRAAGTERGPEIDASGWMIFIAPSLEDAERLASSEPLEQIGWRTHTLCTWRLNEGTAIPLVREMMAKSR
jgi:uncharacterized protein YciI